jgi:hypothetical protein
MGMKVRKELERYAADDNAEIKRHVGEILKELDSRPNWPTTKAPPSAGLPRHVVTTDFTVVGKVSPQEFQIASKYGPLTIHLADVKQGERQTAVRESLRRNVTVDGSNIAQRS